MKISLCLQNWLIQNQVNFSSNDEKISIALSFFNFYDLF